MRPPAKQAENAASAPSSAGAGCRFNEAACKTGGKRPEDPPRRGKSARFNEAACKTGGKPAAAALGTAKNQALQ